MANENEPILDDIENASDEEALPSYKMGDDLIAVVRELVQLTLLTGTNIVDHLRAVQVEVDEVSGKLVPTEDYVEAYNIMVTQLVERAEEKQKDHEKALAALAAKEMRDQENLGLKLQGFVVPPTGDDETN